MLDVEMAELGVTAGLQDRVIQAITQNTSIDRGEGGGGGVQLNTNLSFFNLFVFFYKFILFY